MLVLSLCVCKQIPDNSTTVPILDDITAEKQSSRGCQLFLYGYFPPCCGGSSTEFTVAWMNNDLLLWEMPFTSSLSTCSDVNAIAPMAFLQMGHKFWHVLEGLALPNSLILC